MKGLLAFILFALPLVLGYLAGAWAERRKEGLRRAERRELESYRTQQYELRAAASSGMELSEGSAFRVSEILDRTRERNSK
jgi:hypothetical protein